MLYFSKLRIIFITLISLFFILIASSNIFKFSNELLNKKINLGLDLQGGSYLLLEIDNSPVIEQKLQNLTITIRNYFKEKNIKIKNIKIENQQLLFSVDDKFKKTILDTFSDKENIGIWYNDNSVIKKVAAIGVRVSKWIAYHGFSLNINNDLKKYSAIIPCGIKDKGITNLKEIKNQNYDELEDKLIQNFTLNLQNLTF